MIVTRFAPSPTGYLHLGHAYAAWMARGPADRFLLRIEDLDTTRCREEFVSALFEDLSWLGLAWDEPVLRQSTRLAHYQKQLAVLEAQGLLYPCFCTRKEIAEEIARSVEAPQGPEGSIYPGTCRNLAASERDRRLRSGVPYALRLDVGKAATRVGPLEFIERGKSPEGRSGTIPVVSDLFGDIVLSRKDAPASYHLAVVIDDAECGVTLVTRGSDLFAATHVQRLLQALLLLPRPDYAHHKLVLDEDGRKFSKRNESVTLRALRKSGFAVEDVRRRVGL